jgi:hypothetical protein
MSVVAGSQPEECANPECRSRSGFNFRQVRFQYDVRSQVGSLGIDQILRASITTWECISCNSLIEVWQNLT